MHKARATYLASAPLAALPATRLRGSCALNQYPCAPTSQKSELIQPAMIRSTEFRNSTHQLETTSKFCLPSLRTRQIRVMSGCPFVSGGYRRARGLYVKDGASSIAILPIFDQSSAGRSRRRKGCVGVSNMSDGSARSKPRDVPLPAVLLPIHNVGL